MTKGSLHCCSSMSFYLDHGKVSVEFIPRFREYGISYADSGRSIISIQFCPWCGKKLPPSLREKWFEEIDAAGIDEAKDPIPERLKTEAWYSKRRSASRPQKSNLGRVQPGAIPRRVLKKIP